VVLTIAGEIDIDSGPWLEEHVMRMLGTSGSQLLLDLSGVTFIDCAGLRILLATCRRAELRAYSVRVIVVSREVEWLADLAGLRDAIPLAQPGVASAGMQEAASAARLTGCARRAEVVKGPGAFRGHPPGPLYASKSGAGGGRRDDATKKYSA
jgi:anti-anti-sigma factor